jgi:hypothetical protein
MEFKIDFDRDLLKRTVFTTPGLITRFLDHSWSTDDVVIIITDEDGDDCSWIMDIRGSELEAQFRLEVEEWIKSII